MSVLTHFTCRICIAVAMLALLPAQGSAVEAEKKTEKIPFRSWQTLRTKDVVMQRFDFSCGAASVATLLTFFLGRPTSEQEALLIVRARYTPEDWKKKKDIGLSMEDLAFMAQTLGFQAQGGKLGLAALLKLNGPVIIHLDKGDFQHFTVFRGISGMTVYLADPILGTTGMSVGSFIEQFTGAVLAVWDPAKPLPAEYVLKLKQQDLAYDRLYDSVQPKIFSPSPTLGTRF
jgi:uncharacterized protein